MIKTALATAAIVAAIAGISVFNASQQTCSEHVGFVIGGPNGAGWGVIRRCTGRLGLTGSEVVRRV